jgi:hypothetical protein
MENIELINKLKLVEEENEILKKELTEVREQLNKYLLKNKNYYEKNKLKHIENVKKHKEETNYTYTPSKEQKKEWARRAYLKKKENLQNEKNNKENI